MTIVGCGAPIKTSSTGGWVYEDGTAFAPFPKGGWPGPSGGYTCDKTSVEPFRIRLCYRCCIKFGFLW
jgi:hypothetical protein